MKKNVDRSLLRQGFSIPLQVQSLIHNAYGYTNVGQHRRIKILINGYEYIAMLKNQPINRNKYQNHCDVLQIRYSPQSPIAVKLRDIFSCSVRYIENELNRPGKIKRHISLPDSIDEYILLELNDDNEFCIECFTVKRDITSVNVYTDKLYPVDEFGKLLKLSRDIVKQLSKYILNEEFPDYGSMIDVARSFYPEEISNSMTCADWINLFNKTNFRTYKK